MSEPTSMDALVTMGMALGGAIADVIGIQRRVYELTGYQPRFTVTVHRSVFESLWAAYGRVTLGIPEEFEYAGVLIRPDSP